MGFCHLIGAQGLPLWLAESFDLHGVSTGTKEGYSNPEEEKKAVAETTFLDNLDLQKSGWKFTLEFGIPGYFSFNSIVFYIVNAYIVSKNVYTVMHFKKKKHNF